MKEIKKRMKTTFQIEGKQTVYQHGLSVFRYARSVIDYLEGKTPNLTLKIPDWMIENKELILSSLLDYKTIKHYCIWHDMGKPFCKPDS